MRSAGALVRFGATSVDVGTVGTPLEPYGILEAYQQLGFAEPLGNDVIGTLPGIAWNDAPCSGHAQSSRSWPLARSPSPKRRHYDRELVHSLGLHDRRIPCSRWLMSCLRLCVRHCTEALKQGRLKARSKAVAALKCNVLGTSSQRSLIL